MKNETVTLKQIMNRMVELHLSVTDRENAIFDQLEALHQEIREVPRSNKTEISYLPPPEPLSLAFQFTFNGLYRQTAFASFFHGRASIPSIQVPVQYLGEEVKTPLLLGVDIWPVGK